MVSRLLNILSFQSACDILLRKKVLQLNETDGITFVQKFEFNEWIVLFVALIILFS